MTNPPVLPGDYNVEIVPRWKMERLYRQHKFDELLASMTPLLVYRTPLLHASFCCDQQDLSYVDQTGEEYALITYVRKANSRRSPKRVIRKLLIGTTIYRYEFKIHF